MKARIIRIVNCRECPYIELHGRFLEKIECLLADRQIGKLTGTLDDWPARIPSWCPLPEEEMKIKEGRE